MLGDMAEVKRQAFKLSISILTSKYIKQIIELIIIFINVEITAQPVSCSPWCYLVISSTKSHSL